MAESAAKASRATAFFLLTLANLFWAGNWVVGRALRDNIDPLSLNLWRWLVAMLVLAPFAWRGVVAQREVIRRSAALIFWLALTGVVLFQLMIYTGLRTTPTVNAVLINSSAPLFLVLCVWVMERERTNLRQIAGMLVSLTGILIIMVRGDVARLIQLELHIGDAWILLAMPVWAMYSVLLKRRLPGLGGLPLLFMTGVVGLVLLLPVLWWNAAQTPLYIPSLRWPPGPELLGIIYVSIAVSLGSFICWNQGVAMVGATAAGATLHLMPVFGTLLAIIFLDETFQGYHAAGITIILIGVVLATRAAPPRVTA